MIEYNIHHKKKNSFKITLKIISILLLVLFIIPLIPPASAGGQDATFDSISGKAIPPVQGVGGELKIEASADFFGGCCYHLFAHDVKAELIVPEDVRIISPEPKTVSEVDAVPGGMATTEKFKWTIVGDKPGVYDLEVKVSTSNCGSQNAVIQVSIVKGVSISKVNIHPHVPSVNEEISFLVDVRSGNEFVNIDRTILYIWRSNKDYPDPELSLKTEENMVYKLIGGIEDINPDNNNTNETDAGEIDAKTKLLGEGYAYDMNSVEFSDTWRVRLDEFGEEENIYYWFSVKTSDGKTITSTVYKQEIEDLEKKYQMVDISIWTTAFVLSIGVIVILGISWSYFGRINKKMGKSGIFVLGSTTYTKPSEGTRSNVSGISIQKFQSLIILILFIMAIILIILSFYLGLFDSLITEVGG